MSQRNLRLTSILGDTIVFADPLKVLNTTTFHQKVKQTSTLVGLVGIQRSEMVSTRTNCVKPANCSENSPSTNMDSSVRVSVSSPLTSSADVKQQVIDALENFKRAVENGLLDGLKPNTNSEFIADLKVV